MSRPVLVITHDQMIEHAPGGGHPERPARLHRLIEIIRNRPELNLFRRQAAPVDRDALLRVHDPDYVQRIESTRGSHHRFDLDTATSPASVDAAFLAAGAVVAAAETVLDDASAVPFALVRPPGHHAESARAMGFCLFNNIAVAAAHAIESHGLERVMIIDWDVHHGNGTAQIFDDRPDVLYCSVHQSPCYPGTGPIDHVGSGDGVGFTLNIPLPPGCGDPVYAGLFESIIEPIARAYRPELILISAGFDAHRRDPLAQMSVTEAGFAAMTASVLRMAAESCDGRMAFVLEGGYDLDALAASVHACIDTIARAQEFHIPDPDQQEAALIEMIRTHHARQWPALKAASSSR